MGDSAVARVAELLKHPDDLNQVAVLKQKLLREKAGVDSQLKAGVQAQIEVTLQGLHSLADAKQRTERVKENIIKINKLSTESKEAVMQFDKINNLSRVLQNFEDAQKFVNNFNTMSAELAEIQQLMDQDGEFEIENRFPNLVEVHFRLSKLRDIKDDALFHAANSTEDVRRTISRHFAPLDKLIDRFDNTLFDTADGLLEILREGDKSVIVRVAKILANEQKQDLVADISSDILSSNDNTKTENKMLLSSLHPTTRRKPRNYYDRFFRAVERSIAQTFKNCVEHFHDDPDEIIQNLDWIFADLAASKLLLVNCVPPHWNIFDKYVHYYHRQVYLLLNNFMEQEPVAATLLNILEYTTDYYDKMKELSVESIYLPGKKKTKKDQVEAAEVTVGQNEGGRETRASVNTDDLLYPPLLDGKEDSFYDDYLSLLVSKLREWYKSFASTEKENFISREVPPDIVGDQNLYGLEGEQIMFKLITQQLEVAVESGQSRILMGCVEACAEVLMSRQRDWEKTMLEQVQMQLDDTTTEEEESNVPGGLMEYLIALANDQLRAADFTEAISSQRSGQVSKKYREPIVSRLGEASDGFISLAKRCLHSLAKIIFNDLTVSYRDLFTSAWYKGRPARQISDTILEYSMDCYEHMNPLLFERFMEDMLAGVVLHFLRALEHAGTIKVNKAVERIRQDVEIFYGLFTRPEFGLEVESIQEHFSIFEHVIATWEVPEEGLIERFAILRQDFWDAPLDLFEKMIRVRKDLDNKKIRDIVSLVRSEALQNQPSDDNLQPTFLADFKQDK